MIKFLKAGPIRFEDIVPGMKVARIATRTVKGVDGSIDYINASRYEFTVDYIDTMGAHPRGGALFKQFSPSSDAVTTWELLEDFDASAEKVEKLARELYEGRQRREGWSSNWDSLNVSHDVWRDIARDALAAMETL